MGNTLDERIFHEKLLKKLDDQNQILETIASNLSSLTNAVKASNKLRKETLIKEEFQETKEK